ncbi:Vacuolar protein sorting-associated protein 16 [Globisporangium polare]
MVALRSASQDDKQLFIKSAHLTYSGDGNSSSGRSGGGGYSSRFAFYQTLKQAVARMELAKVLRSPTTRNAGDDGDMEAEDRTHVDFVLAHWPCEVDVVYNRFNEFLFSISIERELEANPSLEALVARHIAPRSIA